jgi:hypothetical protein
VHFPVTAENEPLTARAGRPPGDRARSLERWLAIASIAGLAGAFGLGLIHLISLGSAYVFEGGDQALIGLDTYRAAHLHQMLGPYDRFGWDHPGPAWFYLLVPFYLSFGPGGRALVIGTYCLAALSATAAAAVSLRHLGGRVAIATAALSGLLALAMGPGTLTYPWNPYVVVFPTMLAVLMLAVGGATARPATFAFGLLAGTFAVQSDIASAPLVAVGILVGTLALVLPGWRQRQGTDRLIGPIRPFFRDRLAAAGVGLVVVAWLPPVYQQLTNHPGNLGLIVKFFVLTPQPGHHMGLALFEIGSAFEVIGRNWGELVDVPSTPILPILAVAIVGLIAAAAVAMAISRRARAALAISVAALVAVPVAVLGAADVAGPLYGYLLCWATTIPILALVGLVAALSEPSAVGSQRTERLAPLVAVLLSVLAVWPIGRLGNALGQAASVSDQPLAEAWPAVSRALHSFQPPAHRKPPLKPSPALYLDATVDDNQSFSLVAGLAYQLTVAGFNVKVAPEFQDAFGASMTATKPVGEVILVTERALSAKSDRLIASAGANYVYLAT